MWRSLLGIGICVFLVEADVRVVDVTGPPSVETTTRPKFRVWGGGTLQDEVDDYQQFDQENVKNRANHELKTVTYKPIPQSYDIPSVHKELGVGPSTKNGQVASPQAIGTTTQLPLYKPPPPRTGYFFQHYPWHMLPRRYLLRPGYQYVYPQQYQNSVYSYPFQLPYSDPYGIYRSNPAIRCPYGGCGGYQQGYGSGCGGGRGGGGGGCGDEEGYDGERESLDDDEESEDGGQSGEAHINKKDPLEDLDLEDLEKLDIEKSTESTKQEQKKRKSHKQKQH